MTLEEAIKHLAESLAGPGHNWGCEECKAEHEQLAEWLTELQQWRRVYGVCPSYEMCIPECKEGYNAQIAEYKQLLKVAVDDIQVLLSGIGEPMESINREKACEICEYNSECNCSIACTIHNGFKHWRFREEALKLIGEEGENDA